jgi:hypothetical protein
MLNSKDVAAHLLDAVAVDPLDGGGRADENGRHWQDQTSDSFQTVPSSTLYQERAVIGKTENGSCEADPNSKYWWSFIARWSFPNPLNWRRIMCFAALHYTNENKIKKTDLPI